MGMYNMIFGENAAGVALLALLGLNRDDFYRYRDCYLSEDRRIAVYTRGGGGNRECWDADCEDEKHLASCVITKQEGLRKHPLYDDDVDDEFDNTYATFYFRIPDEAELGNIAPEPDRNALWLAFLGALKSKSA